MDSGVNRVLVKLNIVRAVGQSAERVVEAAPLGVDNHLSSRLVVYTTVLVLGELGDFVQLLDVGSVSTGSENCTE